MRLKLLLAINVNKRYNFQILSLIKKMDQNIRLKCLELFEQNITIQTKISKYFQTF